MRDVITHVTARLAPVGERAARQSPLKRPLAIQLRRRDPPFDVYVDFLSPPGHVSITRTRITGHDTVWGSYGIGLGRVHKYATFAQMGRVILATPIPPVAHRGPLDPREGLADIPSLVAVLIHE